MPEATNAGAFGEPEGLRLRFQAAEGRRSIWFAAEQTRLQRLVALKFLRPSLAESAAFRDAFLDAARQASVLLHPAVLPIINIYPDDNCVAAQWCKGTSLKDCRGTLPPLRVAAIGEVAMDCLSALHATGRCHGNISPGNIFIDPVGDSVWLGDFFQPPLMRDGEREFIGERRFVAPETAQSGASDWLSDLYGLGRVLSEALSDEPCSEELGMLLDALQSDDPSHRGGTPEAVSAAFGRVRRLERVRLGRDTSANRRKRMYRRVPVEFDVSLRRRSATPEETAVILMKTRDIGESGVFVETDDDALGVGSILELDFSLKGIEGNIHAFGIVRWRSAPPMAKGVGVQFVEVDQTGLAKLREFLANR